MLGIVLGFMVPMARAEFKAGAFAMNVVPENFPISVNGNMQDVQAKGVHDPLHARCLVLDDGKTQIALVIVDSCMIPRELMDAAKKLAEKKTGIPTSHILISATHTHTAPTLGGVFQSEPNPAYTAYLTTKIAEGIAKAFAQREPALIGWGVAQEPNQIFNRRWYFKSGTVQKNPLGKIDQVVMNPGYQNPNMVKQAGGTDPDVTVLSVRAKNGRPIALFANYSLHYVGGVEALSADYYGAFADRIAQLMEATEATPAFVGAMSNGTSGDVNNVNFAGVPPQGRKPYEQIRVVADAVAKVAKQAADSAKYTDQVTLAMAERELELGVRSPTEEDVAYADEILAAAKGPPYAKINEIYARETKLLTKYPKTVKAKVQAIRIGSAGVCAIPCEVFNEIGLTLKAKSPLKPTCTISLANGYNGYLPTPAQHRLGGYETWRARSSYLEVDASTKIEAALVELLAEVAK